VSTDVYQEKEPDTKNVLGHSYRRRQGCISSGARGNLKTTVFKTLPNQPLSQRSASDITEFSNPQLPCGIIAAKSTTTLLIVKVA
jgi:hypothetical protein